MAGNETQIARNIKLIDEARANAFRPAPNDPWARAAPVAVVAPQAVAAPAGPGLVDRVSQYFQQAFPAINAARTSIGTGINASLANDDPARAVGNAARGIVTYPAAAAADVVGRPVAALARGVGGVLGGVLGSTGSANDAIITPKLPVAVATNPVASAMAQGASAASAPVSTADDIHQFIAGRLKEGVTNHDLTALAGIASAVPALTKVAQTNKDKIIGTAGAVTDAQYAAELAAAKKLGADSPEYDAAVQKATDKYRQNLATLTGVNPQGLSMQAMLADQQAGDQ